MKELYYTIRYLAHRKGDSLMKIITLTSGLCIGMVLIAKISFDLSYDRWIPEAENLYQVQSLLTHQQGSGDATTYDYGNTLQPIAPAAAVEIPGVQAGSYLRTRQCVRGGPYREFSKTYLPTAI